jgi:hypothetical protein
VARIHFNVSAYYNDVQTLITPTSYGSCASGTLPANAGSAAWIQPISAFTAVTTDMRVDIGGLQANTQYMLCVQASNNAGANWGTAGTVTITTQPLPSVHPAPPTVAATFSTAYPNTSGWVTLNVNSSNCNDPATGLQAQINNALATQGTTDTVISIPAGETCLGNYQFLNIPADAKAFSPNSISTANNTISIPNHGYTEGQQLIPGKSYSSLPNITTSNANDACSQAGQLMPGEDYYYVHVQDANTIQLYCGASQANGGTLIQFTNQGSTDLGPAGNHLYFVPWPRQIHNIIVRTSTPDSQLPPAGTRIGPQWASKMAYLVKPMSNNAAGSMVGVPLMWISDGNEVVPQANIRFVGIEFTTQDSTEAYSTTDPQTWGTLIWTYPQDENIIFDRCWLHGQPEPNRYSEMMFWDGKNTAWIDSYWDNLDFYHATFNGMGASQVSSNSYTIDAGSMTLGTPTNVGKLASTTSITLSGTGSGSFFNYFDMNGVFNVALPPGVTGACSGAANCNIYTTDSLGAGVENDGATGFPNTNYQNGFYVDPVYSSSASCSSPVGFFGTNQPGFLLHGDNTWVIELGTRFVVSQAGYICGIRFFKPGQDPQSTHAVNLWDDSGNKLATASSSTETASGWQTVMFSAAVHVVPGTYRVSYFDNGGYFFLHPALWRNYSVNAGPIATLAQYVGGDGNCDYGDSFPKNWDWDIAGGAVACGTISNGALTSLMNSPYNGSLSQYAAEGCGCVIAGQGPGPYMFVDNYVEGTGLPIHHDDSGGISYFRHDYTYSRNYFYTPFSHMWSSPVSDGMKYYTRQPLEWKSGWNIHISGNIFDGNWVEDNPDGVFIAMTSRNGSGPAADWNIQDVLIENNTFEHGPGGIYGPAVVEGGSPYALLTAPTPRLRVYNNLFWDMNSFLYNAGNYPYAVGGIWQGGDSMEDEVFDHNTVVGNMGVEGTVLEASDTLIEGVQVTNNIFQVNSNGTCSSTWYLGTQCGVINGGIHYVSGLSAANIQPPNCTAPYNGNGQPMADCLFPGYQWHNNLMLAGTGTSASQVSAWWPNTSAWANHNYIPANSSFASQGWFRAPAAAFDSFKSGDAGTNFRFKANYCSGCGSAGTDLRDVGADIDQLEAAEGKVSFSGVTNITATTAQVNFVAPDSAGCPVDISTTDPNVVSSFTRISDAGGARVRNISVTGLQSQTLYYGRVDCQSFQPVFQFKTH